jgi:hypothetical protein
MFNEPETGGTPDEQPGATPETFPAPDQGANIDRCWTCRSMFMQAWNNYGTAWAVVHQWLGVRPDLGWGRVEFVPQVPQGQTTVQGAHIRLGGGFADVRATHTGNSYQTTIAVSQRVGADQVAIGHTLPAGARPAAVVLDGRQVHNYQVVETNRGTEVTAPTSAGSHTLTITT